MRIVSPEFKHSDNRRELTQLLTADIKQVNHYKARKGSVLGNHFHKETYEYFYITKGSVLYNSERIFYRGDIFLVEPNEKHTIDCITDVEMITFLTKPYTKEDPDIYV